MAACISPLGATSSASEKQSKRNQDREAAGGVHVESFGRGVVPQPDAAAVDELDTGFFAVLVNEKAWFSGLFRPYLIATMRGYRVEIFRIACPIDHS